MDLVEELGKEVGAKFIQQDYVFGSGSLCVILNSKLNSPPLNNGGTLRAVGTPYKTHKTKATGLKLVASLNIYLAKAECYICLRRFFVTKYNIFGRDSNKYH